MAQIASLGIDTKKDSDLSGLEAVVTLLTKISELAAKSGGTVVLEYKKAQEAVKQSTQQTAEQIENIQKRATEKVIQEQQKQVVGNASAQEKIEEATKRREQVEAQVEKMKFKQLHDLYASHGKQVADTQAAWKNETDKRIKSELKAELEKEKELHAIYRRELAERPETKKGKSSDVGMLGTKREVSASGGGIMQVVGIGAAIEGFTMLTEKSKEVADAQKALQAGTGLSGKALKAAAKDAEEVGNKLGFSGSEAQTAMGRIASFTGQTGEELKQSTEAALAYGAAHSMSADRVARLMKTEQGRAKIATEASLNIAKAQEAANTPAVKAEMIQKKLMETVGKLALTVLNALDPVLTALMPIIDSLGELLQTLLKPALDAISPILVALTPLLQLVGQLVGMILTPVLKILSEIIQWLVNVAIAPLVQWLAVKVPEAVQKMIGVIKGAIDAVKGAVNAVAGFLGLGDKAASATKQAGEKVKAQDQQNAEELAHQKAIQEGQARQREAGSLALKLKTGKLSAEEESQMREQAQEDGDNAMLAKLDAFDKKKEAHSAAASKKAIAEQKKSDKDLADQWLVDEKDRISLMIVTDAEAKRMLLQAEVGHATKLLAIANKTKQDTLHARAELNKAEKALREHAAQEEVQSLIDMANFYVMIRDKIAAEQKRKLSVASEMEKQEIDLREDGVQKQLSLADFQYREELQKLRDSLEQKQITQQEYDKLSLLARKKNEQDLVAVQKTEHEKQSQESQTFLTTGLQMAQGKWGDRLSSLKSFLAQELQQYAIKQTAESLLTQTGEAKKTALVIAGTAMRSAELVGEGIASAASAAGTWIATAAKAVYNAFETLPFPLDIIGAAAAIGGVYELSTQVPKMFKHAEGGMMLSERFSVTPGGNILQRGEAGPEVDIPLHKVPQFVSDVSGNQFREALAPIHTTLRQIHGATVANGGDTVLDSYGVTVGSRQQQSIINRRKVR